MTPTPKQLSAAMLAARASIKKDSPFYSNMISDDVLRPVIASAVTAALSVDPPKAAPLPAPQPQAKRWRDYIFSK